jgi:hypothetical protein
VNGNQPTSDRPAATVAPVATQYSRHPLDVEPTSGYLYALLGAAVLAWAAAAITAFTQLGKFNDGEVTEGEAYLTIVTVATVAAALSVASVLVMLMMTLRRVHEAGRAARAISGGGEPVA